MYDIRGKDRMHEPYTDGYRIHFLDESATDNSYTKYMLTVLGTWIATLLDTHGINLH